MKRVGVLQKAVRIHAGEKTRLLQPMAAPYAPDGMMDRLGRFFPCRARCHDAWAREKFQVCESELTRAGWVTIWSYQSFLIPEPTPHFRFQTELLTHSQKDALVEWCRARRVSLVRAFGKMGLDNVFPDRPDADARARSAGCGDRGEGA